MISLKCQCGKSFTFSPKFKGQKFNCSQCGSALVVPKEEQGVVVEPGIIELPRDAEHVDSFHAVAPTTEDSPVLNSSGGGMQMANEGVFEIPFEMPVMQQTPANAAVAVNADVKTASKAAEEYYFISGDVPESLKEYAMSVPEDTGPPSEALSVVLSRAAVEEAMTHLEDTLGVRPTPIPIQVKSNKKRRTPMSGSDNPADIGLREREEPNVMQHAPDSKGNMLPIAIVISGVCFLAGIIIYIIAGR
ncbi:MAG: hypothetical protein ACRC2T_15765 [Thermoguttaceae bacterium]